MCGSATFFTALTTKGEVLTFGSALHYACLARTPTLESQAQEPHVIPFLGGIKIRKIASAGWIAAALSHDRDLYVWGGRRGDTDRLGCLPLAEEEEELVRLVDIDGGIDVLDVGVGAEHIIALTEMGEVWATGTNTHGQLGIDNGKFQQEWLKVDAAAKAHRLISSVGCGHWSSWIVTSSNV